MGTNAAGIPYPEATDPIAGYPAIARKVADTMGGAVVVGYVAIQSTANANVTAAVTFPAGKFAANSQVVVIAALSSGPPAHPGYATVWPSGTTPSGFTMNMRRTDAANAYINYVAIGKAA